MLKQLGNMHHSVRTAFVSFSVFFAAFFCIPSVYAARPSTAPKIVNWDYAWSIDSEADAEDLAQWDVLIIDVENAHYSHAELERIKELNPDIKLLAYISLADIRPDASSLDEGTMRKDIGEGLDSHADWIVHLSDGSAAEWWPTYYIMNVTDEGADSHGALFRDYFVDQVRSHIIDDSIWDGVFYDNLWESISFVSSSVDLNRNGHADSASTMDAEWKDGVTKTLLATRSAADAEGRSDRKSVV